MQTGQYAQAYPLLKRLADGAAQRGMAVRAANLYLQAARARLEMDGVQDAVALARRAIQLLVNVGQVERVQMLLPKMVQALQEKGCHDEAIALRAEVTALAGTSSPTTSLPSRGTLPTQCPSCNGPARADEVQWIDDQSAECAYCGSAIQAQ